MVSERSESESASLKADRVGVFLDSASYFAAVREALFSARRQVVILGWDLHTRVELVRGGESGDDRPTRLGEVIEHALAENEALEVFLLIWDYSVIYAAEREWKVFADLLRRPHERLHYYADSSLPVGVSHHQKVVLIDREFAFTGGIDLSVWRWDTAEKRRNDRRRVDADGAPFEPYHDTQWVVSGEVCSRLVRECAYRWKRATGRELPGPGEDRERSPATWPEGTALETTGATMQLDRTYVPWQGEPEVREVEKRHLELIAAAERVIYIENQYFSSCRIYEALRARLEEEDGPEIIIVLNHDTESWVEESTMGLMRDFFFGELAKADRGERLRLLYPVVQGDDGEATRVFVHAKVLIVDERALKIGSSNLSNRSMRVDSELDLILFDSDDSGFPGQVRNLLLSRHLGVSADEFARALDGADTIGAAIDGVRGPEGRSLFEIPIREVSEMAEELSKQQILDPDEPIDPGFQIRQRVPGEDAVHFRRKLGRYAFLLGGGVVLFYLLNRSWGYFVGEGELSEWLHALSERKGARSVLVAVFLLAGLVGAPLNVILAAAVLVFGPWTALFCGYAGSHLSAALVFPAGRRFGKPLLQRFAPAALQRLDRRLEERGIVPVAILRLVPVAPFVVVNAAAGATRLKGVDFHAGTFLGMLPGMFAVVWVTRAAEMAVTDPGITTFLVAAGLVLAVVLFFRWLRRQLPRSAGGKSEGRE